MAIRSPLPGFPLFFFFLILISSPAPATSSKCNPSDRRTLLAIKSFWGDQPILASWSPATSCCSWFGVECNRRTGRIVSFVVATNNLTGTIPPAIGDLTALKNLQLTTLPNLVGAIPPTLGRLTQLTWLHLRSNGLSGPIPASLGRLPKLQNLALDDNKLTGSVPASFGELPQGIMLDLSDNRLSGPLPTSLRVVRFSSLDLSRNRLSGDATSLFQQPNGTVNATTSYYYWVDLSRNRFAFDLGKVRFPPLMLSLAASHNRIYGGIPKQVAELRELRGFDVSYNRLCGEIPTGGNMHLFYEDSYKHNRCLCGTPLPLCKKA